MKRIFFVLGVVLLSIQQKVESANIIYMKKDSARIVRLLKEAASLPAHVNRMVFFGKKFIGLPYVASTLEVGTTEKLVVNLRQMDCTTFVETVAALTLADKRNQRSFTGFCSALKALRYRKGQINGYPSRLHYFSFWVNDNIRKGLIGDRICGRTPYAKGQTINVNYMTRHPEKYKHLRNNPSYVQKIADYERQVNGSVRYYIPKAYVGLSQKQLSFIHDGDILGTVTSKAGLDASHLGIAVWENGRLHFLNASALYHKVVLDKNTLYSYQKKQRSQLGVNVVFVR